MSIKKIANIDKFSFAQMTSNSNGKTSGSGTMGILICTVGTLCFLIGAIDTTFISKTTDVMMQSIIFVGIGTALLGYRKSKSSNTVEEIQSNQEQKPENPVVKPSENEGSSITEGPLNS